MARPKRGAVLHGQKDKGNDEGQGRAFELEERVAVSQQRPDDVCRDEMDRLPAIIRLIEFLDENMLD